jgi:hypothetical protein
MIITSGKIGKRLGTKNATHGRQHWDRGACPCVFAAWSCRAAWLPTASISCDPPGDGGARVIRNAPRVDPSLWGIIVSPAPGDHRREAEFSVARSRWSVPCFSAVACRSVWAARAARLPENSPAVGNRRPSPRSPQHARRRSCRWGQLTCPTSPGRYVLAATDVPPATGCGPCDPAAAGRQRLGIIPWRAVRSALGLGRVAAVVRWRRRGCGC